MNKSIIAILLVCIFLTNCAASYNKINPDSINYENNVISDNIELSYRYAVLADAGNTRYANYERLKKIKVVAVKLKNNSDRSFIIGSSLKFYTNDNEIDYVKPVDASKILYQRKIGYIFYIVLLPLHLEAGTGETIRSLPIGLVLAPLIIYANISTAHSANNKLKDELMNQNLFGKEIKSGETLTGLIILNIDGYNPLSVKIVS
jgi:hypothetical protein